MDLARTAMLQYAGTAAVTYREMADLMQECETLKEDLQTVCEALTPTLNAAVEEHLRELNVLPSDGAISGSTTKYAEYIPDGGLSSTLSIDQFSLHLDESVPLVYAETIHVRFYVLTFAEGEVWRWMMVHPSILAFTSYDVPSVRRNAIDRKRCPPWLEALIPTLETIRTTLDAHPMAFSLVPAEVNAVYYVAGLGDTGVESTGGTGSTGGTALTGTLV